MSFAADEIERLRGEVERLTRERETNKAPSDFDLTVMAERDAALAPAEAAERERDEAFQKYVDANEARIDAEAKVAKLREALKPFAVRAVNIPDCYDKMWKTVKVDIGDLRRARTALQETEQ